MYLRLPHRKVDTEDLYVSGVVCEGPVGCSYTAQQQYNVYMAK